MPNFAEVVRGLALLAMFVAVAAPLLKHKNRLSPWAVLGSVLALVGTALWGSEGMLLLVCGYAVLSLERTAQATRIERVDRMLAQAEYSPPAAKVRDMVQGKRPRDTVEYEAELPPPPLRGPTPQLANTDRLTQFRDFVVRLWPHAPGWMMDALLDTASRIEAKLAKP